MAENNRVADNVKIQAMRKLQTTEQWVVLIFRKRRICHM